MCWKSGVDRTDVRGSDRCFALEMLITGVTCRKSDLLHHYQNQGSACPLFYLTGDDACGITTKMGKQISPLDNSAPNLDKSDVGGILIGAHVITDHHASHSSTVPCWQSTLK